ncbi:sulfite exporter TauE/SafE family protein [Francisella frigiditurris]|uniref:Probable membrane transporter protein n=1 Tax=Francisella frigiditurris TaxID=1542390 RepID=A0A1J0KTU0_9GAMM|nr:sulfite exporter TauE/SafE family protein [Francisella frigiditurris]APC97181.1 sulfite exporter TauE/SafE family protein [Francisella frigiditurris]
MLVILFGLLCGIALGLTGGGGSILAVPMLIYGLKLPYEEAVTISLLVVGLTAMLGFLSKLRDIEFSAVLILATVGMIITPIGAIISEHLPRNILLLGFSGLMIFVGIWTMIKPIIFKTANNRETACKYTDDGKLYLAWKCKLVLAIAGVITGTLTGLFGVGGGFLIIAALIFVAKMPMKKAIVTSLFIVFLISTSGFISHFQQTEINFYIAGLFILGSSIGMFSANKIRSLMNDKYLQTTFAILLIVLGIMTIIF